MNQTIDDNISSHLSHSLADVLEEAVPGVFPVVSVDDLVQAEVPHLDVPVSRARAEHRFVLVHTQTLDGVIVSLGNNINIGHFVIDDLHLEGVEQLGLSDVPDTDLSLLPGGDEKVMLIGVNQSRGPGVVRTETSNINDKFS